MAEPNLGDIIGYPKNKSDRRNARNQTDASNPSRRLGVILTITDATSVANPTPRR